MARSDSGFVCHQHDDLVSYEIHHVWPTGYHGPDIPSNKVKICSNAHSDIHYLLERLLRGKPVDLREYGYNIRRLALQGRDAVEAYAEALSGLAGVGAYIPVPPTAPGLREAQSGGNT